MQNIATHEKIAGETLCLDFPFVVKQCAEVRDWSKLAKVQVALGNVGANYKKTSSYASDGKVQMLLYSREGKEETHEMLQTLVGAMPASHVVDTKGTCLEAPCANIWLYGYDPKLQCTGQTPNGLPLLKCLANGEVKWFFFQTSTLLSALRVSTKKDVLTLADLSTQISGLTMDKIRQLQADGCVIRVHVQKAWETLYVPAGWYTAEESIKGVLVYGVCRSLCIQSPKSCEQYASLTGVYRASEKHKTWRLRTWRRP